MCKQVVVSGIDTVIFDMDGVIFDSEILVFVPSRGFLFFYCGNDCYIVSGFQVFVPSRGFLLCFLKKYLLVLLIDRLTFLAVCPAGKTSLMGCFVGGSLLSSVPGVAFRTAFSAQHNSSHIIQD